MKNSLYIIAAGLGTRMGNCSIPKALMCIGDVPNILNSALKARDFYDHIFIVGNIVLKETWEQFFVKHMQSRITNAELILINSGMGDGHAVLEALTSVKDDSKYCTILWGDAYIPSDNIFEEILDTDQNTRGCAPVVLEKNPYVTFLLNTHMTIVSADFSKAGENHLSGFHDQSIFKFDRKLLLLNLELLNNAFWKNGRYITDSGEMTFLYVLHFLFNQGLGITAYQTENKVYGFNTVEELNKIKKDKVCSS